MPAVPYAVSHPRLRQLQGGAPPLPGDSDGWHEELQSQWGWDFMLFVVLLFVLYCIGGFLRNGAGGLHSLPHASFWQSLPQLVADGVRFTLGQRTHADMLNNRDGRRYSRSSAGRGGLHRDSYAPIGEPDLIVAQGNVNRGTRSGGNGRRKYSMPTEEDRQPSAAVLGTGEPDEDEWRNRKTKDTRREEREERERRVAAWVHSGGTDAHWMLSAEDKGDGGRGSTGSGRSHGNGGQARQPGMENVAPQEARARTRPGHGGSTPLRQHAPSLGSRTPRTERTMSCDE